MIWTIQKKHKLSMKLEFGTPIWTSIFKNHQIWFQFKSSIFLENFPLDFQHLMMAGSDRVFKPKL